MKLTCLTMSVVTAAIAGLLPVDASAQTIGTFRWQLSPFCNVLTVTVVQQGGFYQLVGTDDGCGTSSQAPVTGTAFVQGTTVRMGLTVISNSGGARNYAASISLATFSGTWSDGDGSGALTFNPAMPAAGTARGPVETVFAFGHIREDGSIRNGSARLASVTKVAAGRSCVNFTGSVAQDRLESAVVGLAGGGAATIFGRNTNGQQPFVCPDSGALAVRIVNAAGADTDGRFSFIVP